jgi:hypothetical protein
VAQPLRQIRLAPGSRAARLRTQLACLGHDATCLSRARHRVAPGDGVVAGGPGQHKAFVAVEDRQKLGRGIGGDVLGMVDRALHGVRQSRETGEDQRRGPARQLVGRCAARQGQREGVVGVSVASRKMRRDATHVGSRLDRQGQVEHGSISDGAGSLSPRLIRQRPNRRPLPRSGGGHGSDGPSELTQGSQAQLRPGADDDVVVQRQAEILAPLLDLLGHAEIGFRWGRIARGMVVDQDQGAGVQHQRPLDHLARIDRDVIDRAGREKLIRDDAVLAVEVEDVKALDGAADGDRIMPNSA